MILRDQGLPLPAGAILISPWVDLTHSFPSVADESPLDYIPAHGFLQRPSAAWPPPNLENIELAENVRSERISKNKRPGDPGRRDVNLPVYDSSVTEMSEKDSAAGLPTSNSRTPPKNSAPGRNRHLSILLDGELVEIKDQIQMYTTNQLLSHPLVSPVLQPSLGGLPPLLIMTGGGEMLRDEQIYLAHKAANPEKYTQGRVHLDLGPGARGIVAEWRPTDVQLQVWDDLCHVAPTLSFTRPAKYMYRSIAQFGAWALARAQQTGVEITDGDSSSGSDTDAESISEIKTKRQHATVSISSTKEQLTPEGRVGKAGDTLPLFYNHMIRQRVDRHGHIYALASASSLPALQMSTDEIGTIKPGPVRKWLDAKGKWDVRFAKEKRKVEKKRIEEMLQGYEGFGNNEFPPPSALAGRRGLKMPQTEEKKMSWGMSLWSLWGSSHDEKAVSLKPISMAEKSDCARLFTDKARGESRERGG